MSIFFLLISILLQRKHRDLRFKVDNTGPLHESRDKMSAEPLKENSQRFPLGFLVH